MGMIRPAKIVFAGSPEFAVPCLRKLNDTAHELVAVLTQPDRRAGRGRRLTPGPIKCCADDLGLDVMQPASLLDTKIQGALMGLHPDLIVVVAYGLLLPAAILNIPRVACVNVHASLLPRWRGASPVQTAILSGDSQTGVSLMQMDEGLDTGPVYARASVMIDPLENAGQLQNRLAQMGADLLAQNLNPVLDGSLQPHAQTEQGATYAGRIDKTDAIICWNESAQEIQRKIRAYNPWPVAESLFDDQRLRCWSAAPVTDGTFAGGVGEIIDVTEMGVRVQTGEGLLTLTEVQLPGRQKCSGVEFANGYAVVGKRLGG
jgi:methionyl-tRNA formyltransferase